MCPAAIHSHYCNVDTFILTAIIWKYQKYNNNFILNTLKFKNGKSCNTIDIYPVSKENIPDLRKKTDFARGSLVSLLKQGLDSHDMNLDRIDTYCQ